MTVPQPEQLSLSGPSIEMDRASLLDSIQSTQRQAGDEEQILVSKNVDVPNAYWLGFFSPCRGWLTVLVLNHHGETLLQKDKRAHEGKNLLHLNLADLLPGAYRLVIINGNQVLTGHLNF